MLCAIPMEISSRELDGVIYLSLHLAKQGMSTLFGERMVDEYVFRINRGRPVIYFDQDQDIRNNQATIDVGGVAFNLNYEGIINEGCYGLPIFAHVSKAVTRICLWGQRQVDLVAEILDEDKRHLPVATGIPSFDLASPRFYQYYRQSRIENTYGDGYILVNTNFSPYNMKMDFGKYLRMLGKMKEWSFYKDREVKDRIKGIHDYQGEMIVEFSEMIKGLAVHFPSKQIVVRPHPTEDDGFYRKQFEGLSNVNVETRGTVREWTASAGAVIHHDCTTGIEAFLMDKLVIRYQPFLDEEHTSALMANTGLLATNVKDVVEAIQVGEMPEAMKSEQLDMLRPHFANLEHNASECLAKMASEYADKDKEWLPEPVKGAEWLKCWRKYASKLLRSMQPGHNGRKVRYALSKFPRLSLGEVQDRIDRLRQIESDLPKVEVRSLALNTFIVTPSR